MAIMELVANITNAMPNGKFTIVVFIVGMKKVTVLPKPDSLSVLLERFNEFCAQKIVTIRQNMDQEDATLSPSVPVGEFVSSVTVSDLSNFTPATMQLVEKLVKRSPEKSNGMEPVPTWLLKQHAECMVRIITSIVNMSVSEGVFPDQFKTAHVCPLIKTSTLDCNNLKKCRLVSNITYIVGEGCRCPSAEAPPGQSAIRAYAVSIPSGSQHGDGSGSSHQ